MMVRMSVPAKIVGTKSRPLVLGIPLVLALATSSSLVARPDPLPIHYAFPKIKGRKLVKDLA